MIQTTDRKETNVRTLLQLLTTGGAASLALAGALALSSGTYRAQARPAAAASKLRFDVSFIPQAHEGPITGRVFVMVTRSVDKVPEPRLQIGRTGVPFFGRDVEQLAPEQIVSIDAPISGRRSTASTTSPPATTIVQAIVVVYSEFHRADGHVVWMHDDQWEGQHWNRRPATLYSAVPEGPHRSGAGNASIQLVADQTCRRYRVPPDTKYVKRIKFQSPMLTKFWGRPIYLGAMVLLPRDYDRETISYPVNYVQGHFSPRRPTASTRPTTSRRRG